MLDWVSLRTRTLVVVKKYKYAIIILFVGILMLLISTPHKTTADKPVISQKAENILSVEDQLCNILSSVKGAGKVQVMLSVASGEETLYQTTRKNTSDSDRISNDEDTVIVSDSSRNQSGLIRQINPPVYSGAIIVCQGADDPSVRFAIVEAVSKITGLRTDRISVLTMK